MANYNKQRKSFQWGPYVFVPRWWLMVLTVLGFAALMSLSAWQWHRSQWKQGLVNGFENAKSQPIQTDAKLFLHPKARFKRVQLQGHFDIKHLLWIQHVQQHRLGYDLWLPFLPASSSVWLWVNWGWHASTGIGVVPSITHLDFSARQLGMVDVPPRSHIPGIHAVGTPKHWPVVTVAVNWLAVSYALHRPFAPMVWRLLAPAPKDWVRSHQVITVSPARHRAYALQWLCLAFAWLWIGIYLQMRRST